MPSNPTPRAIAAGGVESTRWSRAAPVTVGAKAGGSTGALSLARRLCPPGYGTSEHVHDELFVAERGTGSPHYGDEEGHADPGDVVALPRGTPHGFRVDEDGGGLPPEHGTGGFGPVSG